MHSNEITLCLVIIAPKGSKYNEKSIGPRMEPCGTPQKKEHLMTLCHHHYRKAPVSQIGSKPLKYCTSDTYTDTKVR